MTKTIAAASTAVSEASSSGVIDEATRQKRRAEMRERYLRFLGTLNGSNAQISMFERTRVSGRIAAVRADDGPGQVLMEKLRTPMGTHDAALLRTRDIVSLHVTWADLMKHNKAKSSSS